MLLCIVGSCCCAKFKTGQTFEPTTPDISRVCGPSTICTLALIGYFEVTWHMITNEAVSRQKSLREYHCTIYDVRVQCNVSREF